MNQEDLLHKTNKRLRTDKKTTKKIPVDTNNQSQFISSSKLRSKSKSNKPFKKQIPLPRKRKKTKKSQKYVAGIKRVKPPKHPRN